MIRRALVFVLVLFGAVALATAAEWADVVAPLDHSILLVEISNGHDGGTCSGIVVDVDRGYVLSAAHCIDPDLAAGFNYTIDGRDAKVVNVNRQIDLAVLKTRLRHGAVNITLAPATPRVGSAVAVLGFPFGARSLTTQTGILANADVDGFAWINADLLPGDSGGAIVDTQGRLVGLTSGFLYNGPAHIGRAVRLEAIRDFVDDLPGPAK